MEAVSLLTFFAKTKKVRHLTPAKTKKVKTMIKDIYKPKLAEILPESIKHDADLQAAAKSIDVELEKVLAKVKLVQHLPRLEELPSDVLDHLAFQYHCDFYKTDLPDAAKRDQIRESIFWHRIKGTPAGVEKAISTFMTDARVLENWEYGGEPYFFKITTRGLRYLSTETEFLDLVNTAKNVRSWLEGIIFDLTITESHELVHAVAELISGTEKIGFNTENQTAEQNLTCGVGELVSGVIITRLVNEPEPTRTNLYSAIAELNSGVITTRLETTPPVDDFWFERWIAERWRDWNLNPVIRHYTHPDDLLPPEPDIFPDGDFLRLYFYFPNRSIRQITMLNPRENLNVNDIRSVAVWWRDLLQNSAGYTSIQILKALLVRQERWKIL